MKVLKPGDRNEKVFLLVDRNNDDVIYTSVTDRDVYTTEEWRIHYGEQAETLALKTKCCRCGKPLIEDATIVEVAPGISKVVRWRFCAVVDKGAITTFFCWGCTPPRIKSAYLLTRNADH